MTGTEVLRRVRNTLGDNGSVLVEDQDGIDAINDALIEVARVIDYPITTLAISTVAGQYEYPIGLDCIKVQSVKYESGSLLPMSREEIEYHDSYAFISGFTGVPAVYYVEGQQTLGVYPAPSSVVTNGLSVRYVKTPTPVGAVGDTLPYSTHIHPVIVYLVTAIFKEKDEDYEAANLIRGKALMLLAEIKSDMDTPGDSYGAIRDVS